jgi:hypothetical protein
MRKLQRRSEASHAGFFGGRTVIQPVFTSKTEEVISCLIHGAMEARMSPELRAEYIVLVALGKAHQAIALVHECHQFHIVHTMAGRTLYDRDVAILELPQPWNMGLPGGKDEALTHDA